MMDSIEVRKGLEELEPLEDFRRNPCEYTLVRISKLNHTPEMLEAIFHNPHPEERGLLLLRIVSKHSEINPSQLYNGMIIDRNIYTILVKFCTATQC